MRGKRDSRGIPFGPQFSPEQTPLPVLLEILENHQSSYDDLLSAIRNRFFNSGTATDYNKNKKADNTTLALRDYGIIGDDKFTLTEVGRELVVLRKTPQELYERFARHILTNLNGLVLVQTVQDLLASGNAITLEILAGALAKRGISVPATATHLSALKGWLRQAGVFKGGKTSYQVDEQVLERMLGDLKRQDLDAILRLTQLQRNFLKALARFPIDKESNSQEVAGVAEALYGVTFSRKNLPAAVLNACAQAGFISTRKTTSGRGAKPFMVRPTAKFKLDILIPLLERYEDKLGGRLRELLRLNLTDLVRDLESPNKNLRGKALELLALYLMFTLDLEFVGWRKRGRETGGAEVDVIVESARLVFSRWQIQCKVGKAVTDDVAKEYGLSLHLKSNVIVVLTTKQFSPDSRRFAASVMRESNLQVILIDGSDLLQILQSPARLTEILHRQSGYAMKLKTLSAGSLNTG